MARTAGLAATLLVSVMATAAFGATVEPADCAAMGEPMTVAQAEELLQAQPVEMDGWIALYEGANWEGQRDAAGRYVWRDPDVSPATPATMTNGYGPPGLRLAWRPHVEGGAVSVEVKTLLPLVSAPGACVETTRCAMVDGVRFECRLVGANLSPVHQGCASLQQDEWIYEFDGWERPLTDFAGALTSRCVSLSFVQKSQDGGFTEFGFQPYRWYKFAFWRSH